jgi:hypothetical protein
VDGAGEADADAEEVVGAEVGSEARMASRTRTRKIM